MSLFIHSVKPLSPSAIFNQLKALRNHAVAPYSHYAVAAIAEIQLGEESYFYTSGVNIENDAHNRLSIHGEQNAVVNAVTLLGNNTKFSKVWIMAAPENATSSEQQRVGKSCGHCRQIMMSLAKQGAQIYTVTLDGRFAPPDSFEEQFLPDSFSEQDLNLASMSNSLDPNLAAAKLQAWKIISASKCLMIDRIEEYLRILSPHVINQDFQTSRITACIVKCNNHRYAAGVLVQDIAFLTTDAIFAAIGNAVTQFGSKNLYFDEIHLASTALYPEQLTATEIEALSHHYVHKQTVVHFYTAHNQHASYSFLTCKRAHDKAIEQRLEDNYPYNTH